ncbi:MAG TPA: SBBP repeat-containing protein [Vicinamibacterales bacterium]
MAAFASRGLGTIVAAAVLASTQVRSAAVTPARAEPGPSAVSKTDGRALEAYGRLPLAFVSNEGQAPSDIRLFAQGSGFRFAFMRGEARFALTRRTHREKESATLALRFVNARADAVPEGHQRGAGRFNYFLGNDPARWRTGLPAFEQVVYRDLWPGINLAFRGAGGELKYEFTVQPGANVAAIQLAYRDAKSLSLDKDGNLQIETTLGVLTDVRPISYQIIGGERRPISSHYSLNDAGYGFEIDRYDSTQPLVIDPGLVYSTFIGGFAAGAAIAVDSAGNAYITGQTSSMDFPTTTGAFDTSFNGGFNLDDAFITKLNATGSALVYSTFLGGSSYDQGWGIAVDAAGNAYITGDTSSADFPTTPGAYATTLKGGSDAFVTKLDPTGSVLVYSTFIGGGTSSVNGGTSNDQGKGIAVDAAGNAFVVGSTSSADFPTTSGAFDQSQNGSADVFVTKLNGAGSALVYSTVLGTSDLDIGQGIAIDSAGHAYVTGFTYSADFPTTPGAFDPTYNGGFQDAFVTKLDATGSTLVYSTFLGGNVWENANAIAVDAAGNAYVTGETTSTNFPTTPGAFNETFNGTSDVFVTELNAAGSALVYSTFVGGSAADGGYGIAVDSTGNAYVTGATDSAVFPMTLDAVQINSGQADAFVFKLNAAGSSLLFSSRLGGSDPDVGFGIAIDSAGDAYVTGQTASSDFSTTPGAFDVTLNGGDHVYNAFAAKFAIGEETAVPATVTVTPATATNLIDTTHTITATVKDASDHPVANITVRFSVTGSVSTSGACTTDANGQCSFTYAGPSLPGADVISAYADTNANAAQDAGEPSGTATKAWVLPASTAGCTVTQGGRITASTGGKATFGGNAQSAAAIRGQEQYTDHATAAPMSVLSTKVIALVCSPASASIFGQATVNGAGAFAFRIDVKDNGEPGSADTYRMRVSNGYDSGEQLISGGNVQIHKP